MTVWGKPEYKHVAPASESPGSQTHSLAHRARMTLPSFIDLPPAHRLDRDQLRSLVLQGFRNSLIGLSRFLADLLECGWS